jgi:hypothetical protein
VPGEILTVMPQRKWRYAGHPYLTGEIKAWRLDIPALGLTPLRLKEMGTWDPKEHYWGEPDEPIEAWAKPMIKRGPRTEYGMEQVLPGSADNPDTDPILEAVDLHQAGDWRKADRMLMDVWRPICVVSMAMPTWETSRSLAIPTPPSATTTSGSRSASSPSAGILRVSFRGGT